jgi:hypothetical protein
MKIDIEVVDLIKWILTGSAWLISVVITYKISKRGKVDDLKIQRRHELVERLSILIQEDHQTRLTLAAEFFSNFEHLDRAEAYEAFEKHESLYQGIRASIERCAEIKIELRDISREIAIYINEDLLTEINKYMDSTSFSYMTDGVGFLINTYGRSFFENLLDNKNINIQNSTYKKILKGLRNVRH